MISMRQGRRRYSTGTEFQCGVGPSPIRRVLGLECVYCLFIVCVLIVLYCPSVSYLTQFDVVRGLLYVRIVGVRVY
jgi:hypothetical protein